MSYNDATVSAVVRRTSNFDYAKQAGIHSTLGPALFIVVYVGLFAFYLIRLFKNVTFVLGSVAFFCLMRIIAFTMRAVLSTTYSAAHDKNAVVAEAVIYGIGYFSLAAAVYALVINREHVTGIPNRSPIARITGNIHLMRLVLLTAVVVGVIGSVYANSSEASTARLGKDTLRKVSAIIFFIVALLLVAHVVFAILSKEEPSDDGDEKPDVSSASMHRRLAMGILLLAALFLAVREFFCIVTINDLTMQQDEKLWYPFVAGTELAAALLLAVPRLIPRREELS